nr:MAG TPA: hypothetical protein [Bacteriophage sp.]
MFSTVAFIIFCIFSLLFLNYTTKIVTFCNIYKTFAQIFYGIPKNLTFVKRKGLLSQAILNKK